MTKWKPLGPHDDTHSSLLARIREGHDPRALAEFAERYGDLIRLYSKRRGLDESEQEDLVQIVFETLLGSLAEFEYKPTTGRFRSYLKTIVLRKSIDLLRSRRKQGGVAQLELMKSQLNSEEHEDPIWEREWRRYHLERAFKRVAKEFNAKNVQAFELYKVKRRSVEEAARELGVSINYIHQSSSRIIRRLTEVIQQQVHEEG